MKKILASFTMASPAGRKQLAGLYRAVASGRDWDVTHFRHGDLWNGETIRRHLSEGCDGIVTTSLTRNVEILRLLDEAGLPIVTIDCPPHKESLAFPNLAIARIFSDDLKAGAQGAQHLLSLGRMRSFGFIPYSVPSREWSRLRFEGAAAVLGAKGFDLQSFDPTRDKLERWLRELPRPSALLAASDDIAASAISLCRKLKIDIPSQLIVLGNDDDELICENTRPRLSSVRIPHEEEGFRAALTLERMMRRRGCRPKDLRIPPAGITVRETTRPISPTASLIDRALAFIRENAAGGISVDDVATHLKVSRRLLFLRFREILGKSVLATITDRRIELLKQGLLTSHRPIAELSLRCGFPSVNHAKRVFKAATGQSMRAWRAGEGAPSS